MNFHEKGTSPEKFISRSYLTYLIYFSKTFFKDMLNIDSYLLYSTKKKVYHKVQFMIIPIDGAHVSKGSFSFEMQNVKILLRHFKYIPT